LSESGICAAGALATLNDHKKLMSHKKKSIRPNLSALPKRKADFIEPMDCAPVTKLADGPVH